MNLETRKLEFVQEFLKLQSEEVISKLERLLKSEEISSIEYKSEPMSKEELNSRIDQSESDFDKGRFKSSSELLSKYK
jgi:arsenate reductase-like glutaredoxin family protein